MNHFIPRGYSPLLDLKQTEQAIKLVKDLFEVGLSSELRLRRVTAPLFVRSGTGINDDLSGTERPVSFPVKHLNGTRVEVVQSLAKWKRMALADYGMNEGYGIYTDMNALRPDDLLDNIHSIYVDQWDWELVISPKDRNLDFLKSIVRRIYDVLRRTEFLISEYYPMMEPMLPQQIEFVHSEDALAAYPNLTPKERERELARKYGAFFLIGIGAELADGKKHDERAPDYDDWTTETGGGRRGLNGDIILWNPVLEDSFEISSMGIRVDAETLLRQLALCGCEERKNLYWHRRLLAGDFPQSVGGGIGQSRLCMYYLRKAHIGEVQAGVWPEELIETYKRKGIPLI
ncbi:MAG TPA: aspartate--ammonia ligase [Spirochaetia bacterium]|nr:aspartate--ammonia ligase [Spirochaetia bacterium]